MKKWVEAWLCPRRSTGCWLGLSIVVFAILIAIGPTKSESTRPSGDVVVEEFKASAFPYDGQIPEQNQPFLEGPPGARFHIAPRGGKLMAATTYSDRRSLLALPTRFDPNAPDAALIVFFHGNLATLNDVKGRQAVPRQLFESGMNAMLVAPQLAVDALDSSAGHFWEDGFFGTYLDEAEDRTVALGKGRFSKSDLAKLPVIIVAYSGGYLATAFTLHYANAGSRIRGVVLLDALFGETAKIENWIETTQPNTFFFSAFSKASASQNADLEKALAVSGVPLQTSLSGSLSYGDVVFVAAPNAVHNDFVTRAWVAEPLRAVLSCVRIDAAAPGRGMCTPDEKFKPKTPGRPIATKSLPLRKGESDCPADAPSCDPTQSKPIDQK